MNTAAAVIGAIVAIAATGGFLFATGIGPLSLGIGAGVVLLAYVIAAATAATGFGEFMRGFLIGINTVFNAALGKAVGGALFGATAGLIIGGVLGLLNFLTAIQVISNSGFYQGLIGWLNWLMPMSWLVVGLGLLFFLLGLIGHLIGLISGSQFFKIDSMDVDATTGTFFTKGGFISNLNVLHTAFNMGNFAFVDKASGTFHMNHEAGHTLNLAAFGWVFHLIGALDENVIRRGSDAYSERLAESNNSTGGNVIQMWT